MIDVSACVVCEGQIHRRRRALVAPFLAKRIWKRKPFGVDLVECKACGFLFYNPRLEPSEEDRLYTGYRSEEYVSMRHSCEPWYTAALNAGLASPSSYELRRRALGATLQRYLGNRPIRRVLDFGGDRGDLVRGLIDGATAFVYDISGAAAVEGVVAVSDPAACNADLIISSNVLEHVGFPRLLMAKILSAAPDGGLVFVEVPCESPFGWARLWRRLGQVGLVALKRSRLARSVVRPSSLYMMHEHVNYFSERALARLLRESGCAVVASGRYVVGEGAGKGDLAWCLGEKSREAGK